MLDECGILYHKLDEILHACRSLFFCHLYKSENHFHNFWKQVNLISLSNYCISWAVTIVDCLTSGMLEFLPLFSLLVFSWTRTLGCGSQLYYAVKHCIIHRHQSMMIEMEQSPKHHKFIVYWHCRSLNGLRWIHLIWILGTSHKIHHSLCIQFLMCCLANVISHITKC